MSVAHSLVSSVRNLRHLPRMAADPLAFFTEVAQEQGGVAPFDFAMRRQWLITDPAAIRTVFVEHADHLVRDRATMTLQPLLGDGLLTSDGEAWRRRRKLTAPSFSPAHLRHYAGIMVQAAADDPLMPGLVDGYAAMCRVSEQIVLGALFGAQASEGTTAILDAVNTYISINEKEFMSLKRFLPRFVSTPGRRQAAIARAVIEEHLAPMLAARRAAPGGLDILARLVDARDPEGQALTDEELRHDVATLLFGGFETSSGTLGFALPLLASRPEVQEALAQERAEVLGDRTPTASDVRQLVKHAAVVDETMRLYPIIWGLGRRVVRPLEVNGHRLEVGDQLNASPWVVHRDPRWWDEPEAFRPERFWEGRARRGQTFFPFGVGPRMCIGQHFARMEAVLVLARWLARRRLHAVPDRPVERTVGVAMRPATGAWVDVEVLP